jgi:cation diffusion facilitator family transporter
MAAHDHGEDRWDVHAKLYIPKGGEARIRLVVILTLVTMVAELIAGWRYGSMALTADGWHMGSHAAALMITLFGYWFARRHANNPDYSFGTGKVGSLAGFASAVALVIVAIMMVIESTNRFINPVDIKFEQAIMVAIIGLLVNLISAVLLREGSAGHTHHGQHAHSHGHSHVKSNSHSRDYSNSESHSQAHTHSDSHSQAHSQAHTHSDSNSQAHSQAHTHSDSHSQAHSHEWTAEQVRDKEGASVSALFEERGPKDHNMRGAYLHVLADALTSLLAIGALTAGWFLGWNWMDPAMGIVGAALIINWSRQLVGQTSGVLLDQDPQPGLSQEVRRIIESDGASSLLDLHHWSLAPGSSAMNLFICRDEHPDADEYKARLEHLERIVHLTIETCQGHPTNEEE